MLPIQVCSYLGAACRAVIGLLRCSTDLLNTQFILPVQGGAFFCLFVLVVEMFIRKVLYLFGCSDC